MINLLFSCFIPRRTLHVPDTSITIEFFDMDILWARCIHGTRSRLQAFCLSYVYGSRSGRFAARHARVRHTAQGPLTDTYTTSEVHFFPISHLRSSEGGNIEQDLLEKLLTQSVVRRCRDNPCEYAAATSTFSSKGWALCAIACSTSSSDMSNCIDT